jgi:CheY-like chemotaxis protein
MYHNAAKYRRKQVLRPVSFLFVKSSGIYGICGIYGISRIYPQLLLFHNVRMSPEAQGSPTPPVKILIADDHPLIRKIVTSTLNKETRYKVVGEAMDGKEAIEKAEKLKPDVVVLNITMPVMDGFEAARRIRKRLPNTAIVILSSDVDQRFINEAKKVGARAYVPKSEAAFALVKAIEAAINNDEFFVVE